MASEIGETMKAVVIKQVGGPEVFSYEDFPTPKLNNPTDVLIKLVYTGINYIDTYHRTGLYTLPLPAILGREGAGVVAAVGSSVTSLAVGDRVAFVGPNTYAQYAVLPEDKVVRVPEGVTLAQATAAMLQGLTTQFLVRSTYAVKAGDSVLVHAAAGGVGGLIVQAAKALGATVIATVSSEAKAEVARAHGADHVINYSLFDKATVDEHVRAVNGGHGVHVVYDGVGKDTWMGSLKSLRKRGTLVLFGNASGPVPSFDPLLLSKHGSLFVTRPTLFDHLLDREELEGRVKDLFSWIADGKLKVSVYDTLPLEKVAEAHTLIESRAATGKVLILIDEEKANL
jgi:NADPH2:quinone reductase